MCGALRDEGQRGACGADSRIVVARAAPHFWEEPPLSGEAGSGAVFFSHCSLGCVYCQNFEISDPSHRPGRAGRGLSGEIGRTVDVPRLAELCLGLQAQGTLNVNFVTPTHYSLAIRAAVALARSRGLGVPVVWNTSGYEREGVVRALGDTADVWLADFKYADEALARRYSHAPDYPDIALRAIGAMLENAGRPAFDEVDGMPRMTGGVIVRHLALPGALEQSKRALEALFSCFGNDVLYSIMNQYTPVLPPEARARFPELARRVSDAEYEELLDFADDLGMQDYFWQEGPAAEESFIPAWDEAPA